MAASWTIYASKYDTAVTVAVVERDAQCRALFRALKQNK
jgi:hypothetical protein